MSSLCAGLSPKRAAGMNMREPCTPMRRTFDSMYQYDPEQVVMTILQDVTRQKKAEHYLQGLVALLSVFAAKASRTSSSVVVSTSILRSRLFIRAEATAIVMLPAALM